MTCQTHLSNGPLTCVRTDLHQTGHVYESTSVMDGTHDDEGNG